MKQSTKVEKENLIIEAAEKIFASVGFKNANMQTIAKEAGITKVTLYAYFKSKENLYMAVTYKALYHLSDQFYKIIQDYKDKSGCETALAMLERFMSFCEENFLYSEVLLEYFAMNRSSSHGANKAKLTDAMLDSLYYTRIQNMQNLPYKLISEEIRRGQQDGSIVTKINPFLLTLYGWSSSIGYIKVISSSGSASTPLFSVNLMDVKKMHLANARAIFKSEITIDI